MGFSFRSIWNHGILATVETAAMEELYASQETEGEL